MKRFKTLQRQNKTYRACFYFLLAGIISTMLWTGCGRKSGSGEEPGEPGMTSVNSQKEEAKKSEDLSETEPEEKESEKKEPEEKEPEEKEPEEKESEEMGLEENASEEKTPEEKNEKEESEKGNAENDPNIIDKADKMDETASGQETPERTESEQMESDPLKEAAVPEPYTGETENLETVRTTARVNVRIEPSLEGTVYTKLPNRTEVARIRDDGEWSAVYYEGYLLYIASAYLRTRPAGNGAGGAGTGASGDGYVIVIDPGHQDHANTDKEPVGPGSSETKNKVTGGTRGTATGLAEYELTLQVSEKIRDELEARGYTVIMTRESHDVDLSNRERADIANDNQADAFIRIHANGSNDASVNGVMTICQTASNPYNAGWYEESRRLSDYVLDEVTAATGAKKQYVWETDTMTGINWAQVPSTILEMGYMTNADEDRRMASEDYQNTIAGAVADAVDRFLTE